MQNLDNPDYRIPIDIQKNTWAKSLRVMYAYALLLAVLPWFLPASIDPSSVFAGFVNQIQSIVPTIDRISVRSEEPDLIRGFLAIAWTFYFPIASFAFYLAPHRLRKWPKNIKEWLLIVIVLPMFFYFSVYAALFKADFSNIEIGYFQGSYQAYLTFAYSGRFGLGIAGACFFLASLLILVSTLHVIRAITLHRG